MSMGTTIGLRGSFAGCEGQGFCEGRPSGAANKLDHSQRRIHAHPGTREDDLDGVPVASLRLGAVLRASPYSPSRGWPGSA